MIVINDDVPSRKADLDGIVCDYDEFGLSAFAWIICAGPLHPTVAQPMNDILACI